MNIIVTLSVATLMNPFKIIFLLLLMFSLPVISGWGNEIQKEASMSATHSLYDFTMKTIDGSMKPLSDFKGKTLLIVNVASKCGFTPQYKNLETLYEKYHTRGFEILGFPANNFMWQEPGTDAEIKKFCSLKYNVTFPMFSKISVKGKDIHPLYAYLTRESGFPGDVSWNFNKFLIGPEGKVSARFDSKTDPLSKELTEKIESLLT